MEWDTEATHVCQKCGTLWRQLDDGHFTLRSPDVYPCCDNAMPDVVPLSQEYTLLALNLAMLSGQKTRLENRIAALEAEKAERERQEPVAWAWNDPAGWMHIQETRERPEWISDEIADGMKLRPLYAHPLALREPTEDECRRIAIEAGHRLKTEAARIAIGRAMFNAVKKVMGSPSRNRLPQELTPT